VVWIAENRETLRQKYPNRHIAVLNNTIINSDAERGILLTRIRERKLLSPVIQYIGA